MAERRIALICALAAITALPSAAIGDVRLPASSAPVPQPKPASIAIESAYAPSQSAHAQSRAAIDALDSLAQRKSPASLDRLSDGLQRLSRGDVAGALRLRDSLPERSIDRDIITWAVALNGGDVSHGQLTDAVASLEGWPGLSSLQRNMERALFREKAPAETVIDALGGQTPLTLEGTTILARSHLAADDEDAARAVIAPYWHRARLEAREESAILREFGELLTKADHRTRMERMLHVDRVNSALRLAPRADAEELAKAWGAVIRKERNADALLEAVPQAKRGSGYYFAKARQLRWSGKYKEAAKVMLAAPSDAGQLSDPDAWWIERRVLSREMLDIGDPQSAYDIAAGHAAERAVNIADAEFHAGWYALRGLRDAEKAAGHFARIAEIADGPISLSRAYFWLGRTAEEGGPGDAKSYFEQAAQYGTAFYGQLAAAKLDRDVLAAETPAPKAEDKLRFASRRAVQAVNRLEAAGQQARADALYRSLAQELDEPGEIALLAAMAERRADHHLALVLGKLAAARGINVGGLSHPVGAIPESAQISGAGKALAYAIARQESEFNIGAVSGAGARGLLQLLPGTAQDMARKAGLTYSRDRLTTDPGYNATLGAAYLAEQLARFDGSYILTFAGYNAGPGRAAEWVRRYGDPRGQDIDTIVDWVERIPFTETRSYVQRVMENYQVYKMRLSGRFNIASDLTTGR